MLYQKNTICFTMEKLYKMHPISNSKEKDLVSLKNFCQYEKLGGTHTMLWFYGLTSRYPLEYLLYSRDTSFHKHYREKAKERLQFDIL
jgi:hypothetical protein